VLRWNVHHCEAPSEQRAARCVAAAEPTPSGGFRGTRSHCTQRACMEVPTSKTGLGWQGALGSEGPGACLERRGGALWCTREPVRLQDPVFTGSCQCSHFFKNRQVLMRTADSTSCASPACLDVHFVHTCLSLLRGPLPSCFCRSSVLFSSQYHSTPQSFRFCRPLVFFSTIAHSIPSEFELGVNGDAFM
jgi:hypothetical protein